MRRILGILVEKRIRLALAGGGDCFPRADTTLNR